MSIVTKLKISQYCVSNEKVIVVVMIAILEIIIVIVALFW